MRAVPDRAPAAPLLVLLALAPAAPGAPPCGTAAELKAALGSAPDEAARAALADRFSACAARATTPLLSPGGAPGRVRALFPFRSAAPRVFLAGDMNGWSTSASPLEKLAGTDLHVLELELPDGARLDYKLVVDGTAWTLDPWNPRTMAGGFGPNSELRTPAYVAPREVEARPGAPRGRYEEITVASRALGGPRRALAWVPPGTAEDGPPLPLLVLLDGLDYREFAKVHTVVENLLAEGRLRPLLLVLVPPVDRSAEYERSDAFERFLVGELLPAVEARWRVRRDPAGRGVMGVSLGGFAALSAVARNAGVFGLCGAQSTGSAVPGDLDLLLSDLARLPAGAARFHLDVGTFEEDLHGADLLTVSRRLRAALERRQPLRYREVPEGHGWGSWRARLAEAIAFLFGEASPGPRDR